MGKRIQDRGEEVGLGAARSAHCLADVLLVVPALGELASYVQPGRRRFRAVWLTTLTTIFGLLPLVYGIGGEDKFLAPAALALGYGLMFGTVLILVFIPAVYLIHHDWERAMKWLIGKFVDFEDFDHESHDEEEAHA